MSLRSTYDQAAYEAERFGPPFQHPLGKPYPEQVEAIERSSRRNAEIAASIAVGKVAGEVERLCFAAVIDRLKRLEAQAYARLAARELPDRSVAMLVKGEG